MHASYWSDLSGGGLELVGATHMHAVNELLLQSFEGFLRPFPGWPLGEAARSSTLRAHGAFLASGTAGAQGHVGGAVVVSERGATCWFLEFGVGRAMVTEGGSAIPVEALGRGLHLFVTRPGG